jgi:hypothetical protein
MFELASTPQDLGEIIVQGIALGRLAFRRLFMLSSLMALVYILRTACLVWSAGDTLVDPAFMMGALLSPKCIAIALLILIGLFLTALFYKRIALAARGQREPLDIELRGALRVWPSLILACMVYFASLTLGLILLVVPGVVLLVSLMFWGFAIVLDGRGPVEALNMSHNLVWGRWWRTLGMLLLLLLPLFILEAAIGGLAGLSPDPGSGPWQTGRIVFGQAVVDMFMRALFSPFIYSIFYVYYHDLKLRKQAAG